MKSMKTLRELVAVCVLLSFGTHRAGADIESDLHAYWRFEDSLNSPLWLWLGRSNRKRWRIGVRPSLGLGPQSAAAASSSGAPTITVS